MSCCLRLDELFDKFILVSGRLQTVFGDRSLELRHIHLLRRCSSCLLVKLVSFLFLVGGRSRLRLNELLDERLLISRWYDTELCESSLELAYIHLLRRRPSRALIERITLAFLDILLVALLLTLLLALLLTLLTFLILHLLLPVMWVVRGQHPHTEVWSAITHGALIAAWLCAAVPMPSRDKLGAPTWFAAIVAIGALIVQTQVRMSMGP